LYPLHFAFTSGGQPALDKASRALRADIDAAQANRELQWYGPRPEPPPQPGRVVCVKGFADGRDVIEPGSIWLASHAVVASAPSAFVPIED
jgi:hypothetical protein